LKKNNTDNIYNKVSTPVQFFDKLST